MQRLELNRTHWWFLVATLCTLLVYVAILASPDWDYQYIVEQRGPQLQRCLGFTASEIPGPSGLPFFAITSLNPNSPLAVAGIRPGDIPIGYQHGFASAFYRDLEGALSGERVTITVMSTPDWDKGRAGRRAIEIGPLSASCQ
jgi:hypothetical protein